MGKMKDTLPEFEVELYDENELGECDSCGELYGLADLDNRCGDCGDCGDCCVH